MNFKKIACVASSSKLAQQSFMSLKEHYVFVPVEQAEVILVLGGDGFLLHCLHQYGALNLPLYGMNRGTVGFLMNEFTSIDLLERINKAQVETLYPLRMTVKTIDGKEHQALAFNEVSIIRHSRQAANLQVVIDDRERIEKLVSDGILVATPAGSTAYNLSAGGSILPIGANVLALTPLSPFRPRRWRGALLPHTSVIEFRNLDVTKRPIAAAADFQEITDALSVYVVEDRSQSVAVLFDPGHSLEDRIFSEQFAY